ncbi:hypothetical protein AB8S08_09610 [Pseudidiomarina sp. PP-1MA]|uniref:Uncharacterized protein n=1 Tax=Pseudidiomarina sp. PP-1MA TaxID=3237706 RepID=A0AB39XA07_9GAMM
MDWKNPEANGFAIAEEVTVKGELRDCKRFCVNGWFHC